MTANGVTTVIPAGLDPLWELSPFKDASGNTPPFIGFTDKGPFAQGPRGQGATLSATVGVPLPLPLWVADDANLIPGAERPKTPPIVLTWDKFRGPGAVAFSAAQPSSRRRRLRRPREDHRSRQSIHHRDLQRARRLHSCT